MNLFSWLIVGHLIGDFLLQTRWMAEGKTRHWFPLVVHALVYTAAVYLSSLPAAGLSLPATALVFLAHLVLDRRLLVDFWARRITGTVDIPWLSVIIDQSWHVVVLAVATLL